MGIFTRKKKKLNKTQSEGSNQSTPKSTEEARSSPYGAYSPAQLPSSSKNIKVPSKVYSGRISQSNSPLSFKTSKVDRSEVLETIIDNVELQSASSKDPDLEPPFYSETSPKVSQKPATPSPTRSYRSGVWSDNGKSKSPVKSGSLVQSFRSGSPVQFPRSEGLVKSPESRSRLKSSSSGSPVQSPRPESPVKPSSSGSPVESGSPMQFSRSESPVLSPSPESPVKSSSSESPVKKGSLMQFSRSGSPVQSPRPETPVKPSSSGSPVKTGSPMQFSRSESPVLSPSPESPVKSSSSESPVKKGSLMQFSRSGSPVQSPRPETPVKSSSSESPVKTGSPMQFSGSESPVKPYSSENPVKTGSSVQSPTPESRVKSSTSESPVKTGSPMQSSKSGSPMKPLRSGSPVHSLRSDTSVKSPRSGSPMKLSRPGVSMKPSNSGNIAWLSRCGAFRKCGDPDAVFCSGEAVFGSCGVSGCPPCCASERPDHARSEETLLSATEKSHDNLLSDTDRSRTTVPCSEACGDEEYDEESSDECDSEEPTCQVQCCCVNCCPPPDTCNFFRIPPLLRCQQDIQPNGPWCGCCGDTAPTLTLTPAPAVGKCCRPKSRELRGSMLIMGCHCNRKNGLQDNCPRTGCQGSSDCTTQPYASCDNQQFSQGKHLEEKWEKEQKTETKVCYCTSYKSAFGPKIRCGPSCTIQVTKEEIQTTKSEVQRHGSDCGTDAAQQCFIEGGNLCPKSCAVWCNCGLRLNHDMMCYTPSRIVPNIPPLLSSYAIPCVNPMVGIGYSANNCSPKGGYG